MFNLHKEYRAAIFLALAMLGGVSLIPLSDIKVLAQISSNVSCSNTEIEEHIKQLENAEAEAFDALVKCNSKSVSALIKALRNLDKNARVVAIAALGEIGKNAEPAVPILINALKDDDRDVRSIAVYSLGKIGTKSKPVIRELINALKHENNLVRLNAADALGKIGTKSEPAIKQLINALEDENEFVRSGAAYALGEIGYYAKDALPMLKKVSSQDKNLNVRLRTYSAISKITKITTRRRRRVTSYGRPRRSETGTIANLLSDQNNKPPIMCKIPAIKAVLTWKCPKNSNNKKPDNQKPQTDKPQQNSQPSQRLNR